MKKADVNRALDKSESIFDEALITMAGWKKPWTSIACSTVLILSVIGLIAIWRWF